MPLKATVDSQSKCIAVKTEISVRQIMEGPAIPSTMFAWRKYKGNYEPVGHSRKTISTSSISQISGSDLVYQVYEEIPVPPAPATGFLVKILAAGR